VENSLHYATARTYLHKRATSLSMDNPSAYQDRPRIEETVNSDESTESTTSYYKYDQLDKGTPDVFRLFLLEPGIGNDALEGSLSVTKQSDGVNYAALSYVWGDTKYQDLIFIDGKHLRISANLSIFLKSLRHPSHALALWTDAICIDQENVSERGHQVRLMGDVYRDADTVYAWLGPDTHNVANLMTFLFGRKNSHQTPTFEAKTKAVARRLVLRLKLPTRALKEPVDESRDREVPPSNPFRLIEAVNKEIDQCGQDARLVYVDLCQRSYWTRMWIIQEILLARSVVICLGQARITWKAFAAIIDSCVLQWPAVIWGTPNGLDTIGNLIDMLEDPIQGRYITLSILLQRYHEQACLDTRDRVYALLSLARDCSGIIPDYTQKRVDLFFRLKDIVHEYSILRGALGLYVDEIKYRADELSMLSIGAGAGTWDDLDNVLPDFSDHHEGESLDGAVRYNERKIRYRYEAAQMFDTYDAWGRTIRTDTTMSDSIVVREKHQTMRVRKTIYHPHLWEVRLEDGANGTMNAIDLEIWNLARGIWQQADLYPATKRHDPALTIIPHLRTGVQVSISELTDYSSSDPFFDCNRELSDWRRPRPRPCQPKAQAGDFRTRALRRNNVLT
jgi:hypothetical protein